jgi:hypothetical protein
MAGTPKQSATPEERALAEIGAKNFKRFREHFAPVITRVVDNVRTKESDVQAMGAEASGRAAAGMADLRAGTQPNRAALQAHGEAAGQAAGAGTASGLGRVELKGREVRGLVSASALGRGIADVGTTGLAQSGQQTQALTSSRLEGDTQLRQGLISAAASGAGAYAQHKGWLDPKEPPPPPKHSGHPNTAT